MKGVVFTEFLDMVDATYSPDVVDDIIEASDLTTSGAYTAVGTYPASEMTALLGALSERVDAPIPVLLNTYGEHLFGRFHELYPEFFGEGADALDFLQSIESVIHAEVRKLYPDAQLPSMRVSRVSPDRLELEYASPRGLADLAEGLIQGTLAHFDCPAAVVREDLSDDGSRSRFTITREPA